MAHILTRLKTIFLVSMFSIGMLQNAFCDTTNTIYVSLDGGHVPPYDTWVKAATNLNDAVDIVADDTTIIISNGTHLITDTLDFGFKTNVVITSIGNNPNNVTIKLGSHIYMYGQAAFEYYYANNCWIIGCTIDGKNMYLDYRAINCYNQTSNVTITNCIFQNIQARGVIVYGTIYNSKFENNYTIGNGGVCFNSIVYNSEFINNIASSSGGACYGGIIYNSTFTGNSAIFGGACRNSTNYNCTFNLNGSDEFSYSQGGACYNCDIYSCIFSENRMWWGSACAQSRIYNSFFTLNYSDNDQIEEDGPEVCDHCSIYNSTFINNFIRNIRNIEEPFEIYNVISWFEPFNVDLLDVYYEKHTCGLPPRFSIGRGEAYNTPKYGNMTNDPLFINVNAGNFNLQPNSPAINAGSNYPYMTDINDPRSKDLAGNARINPKTPQIVDIGAYEFYDEVKNKARFLKKWLMER